MINIGFFYNQKPQMSVEREKTLEKTVNQESASHKIPHQKWKIWGQNILTDKK